LNKKDRLLPGSFAGQQSVLQKRKNMRTLIFIFCLFWSLSVIGQGNWYVGASATPYSYWLYNSDAMASDRVSYQTNLFGVNGFQGQLMIGRKWNDNLSLESGLTYCWQVQRFGKSEPEANALSFLFTKLNISEYH
jgi:hypothetical protein